MQILVVEDEKRLAEALAQIIRENKYMVDIAFDGEDGYDYAMSGLYDVIVLDVMLPKKNGFDVVRKMRENRNKTPVILLTAKDAVSDKVKGLDCGADDYMTKPFSPEELLARIRAVSRRQGEVVLDELEFADLTLNISTYDLACGERSVHLGFKEVEVLKLLMSNPDRIVEKENIIVKVWGLESDAESNNVEAYISFLRRKIEFIGSKAEISAVRKVGYRLSGGERID